MEHNNTYLVIEPSGNEKDNEDQIEQLFGSNHNSKPNSSSLKLDTGNNNQLKLSVPKMENFRGYERASPYKQYDARSTSPLDSVFGNTIAATRDESVGGGYHQHLQSYDSQATRYPDWNPTRGYRKSPEITQQQQNFRPFGSQSNYADPYQPQQYWGAYQGRATDPLASNVGGARFNAAAAPYSDKSNRYGNMPMRSPVTDPYASYGGSGSFSDISSGSYSRDEFNPFSPGTRSSFPATPTMQSSKSPSSSKGARITVPPDGYIYQVQFKRAHKNYILAPSAPRDILPGDFVKVEADRGEDMGIVLAKIPESQFEEVIPTAGYRGRGFSSGQGERKYLYRLATQEEKHSLTQKVLEEEKALETIREKATERGYPMVVLDAEYQFDRHKLTFYFEADRRIDFRELVSELFSQYKTRIWMQQVDTSSLPLHDPGTELAKATGFLPEREEGFSSRSSFSLGETTKDPSLAGSTESDIHGGYLLQEDLTNFGNASRAYNDPYNFSSASFSLPTSNDPWSSARF